MAPIALYPDPILAQVLVAATYPLELVQLQQWLEKNPKLKDKALTDAVMKQPWDPSIQAMAALPDAVKLLADDIQWTTDLGNAFLAQQGDVMDAVQRMRKKAQDKGALKSNEQMVVETQVVEEKTVIVVESANPEVIYVPSYNPVVVYRAARVPVPADLLPATAAVRLRRHRRDLVRRGRRRRGGLGPLRLGLRLGRKRHRHRRQQQLQPQHQRQQHQRQPGRRQHLAAQPAAPGRGALLEQVDGEQVRRHGARGFTFQPPIERPPAGEPAGRQHAQRQQPVLRQRRQPRRQRQRQRPVFRQRRQPRRQPQRQQPLQRRQQPGQHRGPERVQRQQLPGLQRVRLRRLQRQQRPVQQLPRLLQHEQLPQQRRAKRRRAKRGRAEVIIMYRRISMQPRTFHSVEKPGRLLQAGIVCAGMLALALSLPLLAAETTSAPPAAKQKLFDQPKLAAEALIQAAENYDVPALLEILGADAQGLVVTEDTVQDKNNLATFAAKAREKTALSPDPKNKKIVTLSVGADDWPMPIPIIKEKGKWRFDTQAGRQEILYRRIGGNELDAIQICRGFVEAQHEYATEKHDGAPVNQYAQRIISTPGKRDGLAWRNEDGTMGGPVGESIAKAIEQGYSDKAEPFHGYYFKVLKGQGPAAPLGEMNFVVQGLHDRRLRAGGGAGGIRRHGPEELHRQPRRRRLREGPGAGFAEDLPRDGTVQPRRDLAPGARRLTTASNVFQWRAPGREPAFIFGIKRKSRPFLLPAGICYNAHGMGIPSGEWP